MLCVQRNTRNGSVSVLLKMPERAQPWSPFGKPLHRFQSPQGNCISVSASLFQHIKCQQPGQMPFSLLYSQEGFCFLWFFSFRCCPFPGRAGSCWTKPRVVQGCSGVRSCCWSSSLDLGLTWFPAGKVVLPVECSCSCAHGVCLFWMSRSQHSHLLWEEHLGCSGKRTHPTFVCWTPPFESGDCEDEWCQISTLGFLSFREVYVQEYFTEHPVQ